MHVINKIQLVLIISFLLAIASSCSEPSESDSGFSHSNRLVLTSLSFKAAENADILIEDVIGEIIGDSVVECWIPHLTEGKLLKPKISYNGGGVFLDNQPFIEGGVYDFRKPVRIIISADGNNKEYIVYVHSYTGLPVLWIETENRREITSLEEYVNAHYRLSEDVITRGGGDILEGECGIRGRGNSTWGTPKKPYRMKLNKKTSLLGEPADKHWVLLANYYDRTMMKNAIAFYMGAISKIDYTPKSHFVELMLNGRYNGTYQITEALTIGKNRIDIGDDGFILEIDNHIRSNEIGFETPHLNWPIRIHKPEVSPRDIDYLYIRDFVLKAEETLYSDVFLDKTNGYKKYFDVESIVDWYLIFEMLQNPTVADNGYMTLTRGGKLKMGPLWDFDLAFGYNPWAHIGQYGEENVSPTTFWAKNGLWFPRFFQDPEFVRLVKSRFAYFYSKKSDIFDYINANALYLKRSAEENNKRWGTLYESPVNQELVNVWGSYYNEVKYIKDFMEIRFEWLKEQFENM